LPTILPQLTEQQEQETPPAYRIDQTIRGWIVANWLKPRTARRTIPPRRQLGRGGSNPQARWNSRWRITAPCFSMNLPDI